MTTPKRRKIIHSDANLQTGSDYLEYHVSMFVETLLWLRDQVLNSKPEGIMWNAMLEDYLIHARILINFICKSNSRDDDVIAVDYFHDLPGKFKPSQDNFLMDLADRIGGCLVHITTKPMPDLKSQQNWPIDDIASRLNPVLMRFLRNAPESRLAVGVRNDCINHLSKVRFSPITLSVHAST